METGWLCPRCNTVNAPWKSTCDCTYNPYMPVYVPLEWDKGFETVSPFMPPPDGEFTYY